MKKLLPSACLLCAAPFISASAHGIVGDRFFPATLNIDDPAVADELTLPQISALQSSDSGNPWETTTDFEVSKRLTKNFGLSLGGSYIHTQSKGGNKATNGFDNFALAAKYQFYSNAEHELMLSAGLDMDMGDTGSSQVGAESFSTYTPQIFFGKGFGDLPDSMDYLKPFAFTGQLGVSLPDDRFIGTDGNPDTFNYGFTLQYSIPYLQQHVKDVGIGAPFNGMIPIVEFAFQKPLDRTNASGVTGTINPGFIWSGKSTQFGLEAIIPVNDNSGHGVGAMAQVHFYLDDLFPATYGKPLFD